MQEAYYQSDQMAIYLIFILIVAVSPEMVALKQWGPGVAHTDLTISANIYNDNSKFVTGSNDRTVKIWSLQDYSLLHTQTFTDIITHVSLHPLDNRIFILVFDGTIKVLDPNNYAALHTGTYPTAGGNGNFLRFFSANSKYIIGGYDTTTPVFHIFNSATYAAVAGGATTAFASGQETTVTSVSKDGQLLAAISTESSSPIHLLLYNLATNTLSKTFLDNFGLLKWVLFNPHVDQLHLTSNDKSLRTYRINPTTSEYDISYVYSTEAYGFPNCINANIKNQLVFSANSNIVFLNTTNTYPELIFSRSDLADVFSFDISTDGKFLLSGMRNGEVTLWQIGSTATKKDQDLFLLIVLGASIGGFVMLIFVAIIVRHFCCKHAGRQSQAPGKELEDKRVRVQNKTENSIAEYDKMDHTLGIH